MALNLSKEQQMWLERLLRAAEPYEESDPVFQVHDGDIDTDRWNATMAKRFLKQAGLLDDGD